MTDLEEWVAGLGEIQRCRCGHYEGVHLFGRRGGVKVRTACTHGDAIGACQCRLFRLAKTSVGARGGNPLSGAETGLRPPAVAQNQSQDPGEVQHD